MITSFGTFCLLMATVSLVGCTEKSIEPSIAVNQIGYNIGDTKHAYLANVDADSFMVVDIESNRTVYTGPVTKHYYTDRSTGHIVNTLDFSNLESMGWYRLELIGKDISSSPFLVGTDVYRDVTRQAVRSFYYQRCGTAIKSNTSWDHPVCHLDDAVLYARPDKHVDATGGWHDAGDYSKISVTAEISLAFLLNLYEHRSDLFTDQQLDIPESGNGIPDLLDEIRWGLTWMLKMQRDDGGVYHKLTIKKWTGEHLPHEETDKRYLFKVSSNATGAFAAVAAIGARVFQTYEPDFAERLTIAARNAWQFLENNPVTVPLGGFTNPIAQRGPQPAPPQTGGQAIHTAG